MQAKRAMDRLVMIAGCGWNFVAHSSVRTALVNGSSNLPNFGTVKFPTLAVWVIIRFQ